MRGASTYFLLFFIISSSVFSQIKLESFLTPSDTLNTSRRKAVFITEASLATASLIGLHQLWYADYPQSSFHTINDNNQWLQMDKVGHVFSAYQLGRMGSNALEWSGADQKDRLVYGATAGFVFLTTVEVFDGISKEWGFSWGDMIANATGTVLYVGQELLWNGQRINLKYSFHQTRFSSQRTDKLGESFFEELLKDYNGQTFWLSVNVHSFFKESKIPRWLNVAFGYGAEGMLSGHQELVNNLILNTERSRQYYLSLDVDLTKIKTDSHVLKTIFDVLNVIKLPFPALEIDSKGGVNVHFVYF